MNKLNIFLIVITALTTIKVNAQSDLKLSVQAMQPMIINPAYAGSYDGLSISAMHSSQWTGFEGAPSTQFFTGSFRFINDKVGAGLLVSNDQIGPVKEFNVEGNYSYTIKLNDDIMLSMGLKAGLNNFAINYDKLNIQDPGEINDFQGKQSQMTPLIGAGLYLFTDNIFVGTSVPSILTTSYLDENERTVGKKHRYIYSTAGYQFKLDYAFYLTPMLQYRYTSNAPSSVVFLSNIEWEDKVFGGINTDFDSSFGAFFALRFMEYFKIAYAYDTSINSFSEYNNGGHSFKLTYELPNYRFHARRPYNRL